MTNFFYQLTLQLKEYKMTVGGGIMEIQEQTMKVNEESIGILTKMYIEEYFKDNQQYIFTKAQLIQFCIKLLKEINKYE